MVLRFLESMQTLFLFLTVFDWRQTSLGCLQAEAADSMSFLSQDFPAMFRCADVLRENFFVHAVHTFFVAMAHCAKFSP